MNHRSKAKALAAFVVGGLLMLQSPLVRAGPGPHGPSGEHLDSQRASTSTLPPSTVKFEAKSELFELVGTLTGGALSILIDRFQSNEPLLGAQVEVESGGVKAKAAFHADTGDYSVDDPHMLKQLLMPGEHPIVITVIAGPDADLLDAVLRVQAQSDHHDHHIHWAWWAVGGLIVLGVLALGARRLRARQHPHVMQGDQA